MKSFAILAAILAVSLSAPADQPTWQELSARLIQRGEAAPLGLTTNYTTPASYFDKITSFPACGVMVEAGGITGNNVFRIMTRTNLDFVLDGNGELGSYQH